MGMAVPAGEHRNPVDFGTRAGDRGMSIFTRSWQPLPAGNDRNFPPALGESARQFGQQLASSARDGREYPVNEENGGQNLGPK